MTKKSQIGGQQARRHDCNHSISIFFSGMIEESVVESVSLDGSITKYAGYYSLAIIYAFYTLGNLTAAQIVDTLTPKWAMCIGALCYASFQVHINF